MLYAISPIFNLGKGVTVTDHECEDTHTEFEGRMQESKYRIICHNAHRYIVSCTTTTHMKNNHEEDGNTLDDLGIVTSELKIGCLHNFEV